MKELNIHQKIREVVKQIPEGKVSTYGAVAKAAGFLDARMVVWAIYGKPDDSVPCHRIVSKEGNLAKKFSVGGMEQQRAMLEAEGVECDETKVDLNKFGFFFG